MPSNSSDPKIAPRVLASPSSNSTADPPPEQSLPLSNRSDPKIAPGDRQRARETACQLNSPVQTTNNSAPPAGTPHFSFPGDSPTPRKLISLVTSPSPRSGCGLRTGSLEVGFADPKIAPRRPRLRLRRTQQLIHRPNKACRCRTVQTLRSIRVIAR